MHPRATPSTWSAPKWLGGVEIVGQLGAGGMGTVYLGRDPARDRLVAVKVLAEPAIGNRNARERFALEATALARVHHVNVVAELGTGEVGGLPYLIHELVAGPRLDELERPAPWPCVLRVAVGLARAVAAVHAAGVLHRDIKPSNVMLSDGGAVKLIDFGLAKLQDGSSTEGRGQRAAAEDAVVASGDRPGSSDRTLTGAGSVVGTPRYLAPEMWGGAPASERTDLYAMGLVLYLLLAGELPHGRLRGQDLVSAVRSRDLPRLADELPDVPRELCELIDACVERDPARRPASADEVVDVLEALAAARATAMAGARPLKLRTGPPVRCGEPANVTDATRPLPFRTGRARATTAA